MDDLLIFHANRYVEGGKSPEDMEVVLQVLASVPAEDLDRKLRLISKARR